MFKILDCTLRDGGYYTNWDFDRELVKEYCLAMEKLPIEYIEIGYRSIPLTGYLGEYYYCPAYVMRDLKALMPSKKLTVILNEKDIRVKDVKELLTPCLPYIDMVRIAIDPVNLKRALELAKSIKHMGFKVAFNVMYMSNWKEDSSFLELLGGLENTVDYFYMVDSFGGIMPEDVDEIISLVKSKTGVPLGFHGHNNLEMALANTLLAAKKGCSIVDATITGIGRGAGNLRTELLLTYLDSRKKIGIKYNQLSSVVSSFEYLKKHYEWGTNLPYMYSGAYSLPQKKVMEWVGMNRYSVSNILNALNNQKEAIKDNLKLPVLQKKDMYKTAIIVGGGKSAKHHKTAIKKLLENRKDICLIHAGVRNVMDYLDVDKDQYYALVGFESEKLLRNIGDLSRISQTCVYPPYPRNMGTIIPEEIKGISKEIGKIDCTDYSSDSPMALAVQIALDLGVKTILMAGFDGYDTTIDQIQFTLAQENQNIINDVLGLDDLMIFSITPTKYQNIETTSVYSFL